MSTRNAEDELFARWREVVPTLVKDGVVDEPRFVESSLRLRSTCAINVKKSPGGSEAVDAEVHAAARRDRAFLAAQLALYSPAVYVWCGVSPDLVFGSSLSWQTTGRGVRFAEWTERDSVFIQCSHPLARWPRHLTYYSLMDAVRSIVP